MPIRELRPILVTTEEWDGIEARIKKALREAIYLPLLKQLGIVSSATIQNAAFTLEEALASGRVTFSRGKFSGKFSASLSKELKSLGAQWNRKSQTWDLRLSDLPISMRGVIASSEQRFLDKLKKVDQRLEDILPEAVAAKVKATDLFDRALFKTERDFQKSIDKITVAPQVTSGQRKRIAEEWQENLDRYIRDFTEEQVQKLREEVKASFFAGNRYEALQKSIQESYSVTEKKAKFLARQETHLLMAKFKESRYQDAGVHEYTWHRVAGSPLHPVRPKHKALAEASAKGKVYRWDDPPNTAEEGDAPRYNNPGEDFNCRCFARPVVRFKS